MKYFRKSVLFLLLLSILITNTFVYANDKEVNTQLPVEVEVVNETKNLNVTAKSAILMEASTGEVLYDKNGDERLSPASITKIMTLILIFDALDEGRIKLEDEVITSEHAKSMGGSQVFLETGEIQSVETLIKCIIVASGNDASVAMAEFIAGSENEFVNLMNKRAKELGMNNTHFVDCCGLTDSDEHYSTAKDVAIMSRELITRYPDIKKYSCIWMENITHTTNQGTKEFGLTNTNKLLKQYEYTTGLKTGSTSKAKYCVSATAQKDNIEMIAVIMAAPDYKVRFSEAKILLEYGFNTCKLFSDNKDEKWEIKVKGGKKNSVSGTNTEKFSHICKNGESVDKISKKVSVSQEINAPIKKGSKVGEIIYTYNGKTIGSVDIVALEDIEKTDYKYNLFLILKKYFLN